MTALPDMADHILAIEGVLAQAGWDVHVGDVLDERPPMPYALIHATAGVPTALAACGTRDEISELVRITIVDTTPLNALRSTVAARAVLDGVVLTVPGRSCSPLRLVDHAPITVDREVTLPDGTHPAYGVDVWRLTSTPTKETT